MKKQTFLSLMFLCVQSCLLAQNPIIRNQFTADPSARVFEGKVYLYPSHDIPAPEDYSRKDWFCMADYHVFSSKDLTHWTDHGVILDQKEVSWVNPKSYSMWAPDCIFKGGKYYLYFPAIAKDSMNTIGVAVGDKPYGPFVPQCTPIKGIRGIDPNTFIDTDGHAYLYWAAGNIYVGKLKSNMLELDSIPQIIRLPKGFKEGPYMFKRGPFYYLTYPMVLDKRESLVYSMGKTPIGPFEYKGVIMDQSPTCWTNHHSIIQYNGQWYLFYHNNDLSSFDKNRSVRIDYLSFNKDGTIKKVTPTLRGVGVSNAFENIRIDRYSAISNFGVHIEYIDSLNKFMGWQTEFTAKNAWLRYDRVDFGKSLVSTIFMRVIATHGALLTIYQDHRSATPICKINVPASNSWQEVYGSVNKCRYGIHHLFVANGKATDIKIRWIKFR